MKYELPTTVEELEDFVTRKDQESIHLDYKSSRALDKSQKCKNEIAKDVSSFANSDGGLIIYGIEEKDHLPIKIDSGVKNSEITRETIERIINTNITPPIEGVLISQIPITGTNSAYCILIPKSFRTPHQAPSKHYYKRYNFESKPMEHFEIEDLRRRSEDIDLLINIDIEVINHGAYLIVENIGKYPAKDVKFDFPADFSLKEKSDNKRVPNIFLNGVKYFPTRRKFSYYYHTLLSDFTNTTKLTNFTLEVTYNHPLITERVKDTFYIDLEDFIDTINRGTDIENLRSVIKDGFNKLDKSLLKLDKTVAKFKK